MEKPKRFSSMTDQEIEILKQNRVRENTKRVVKNSVSVLRTYLQEKREDINFET